MHLRVVMGSLLFGSSFASGLSAAQSSANIVEINDSAASALAQESVRPSLEAFNRLIDRTIAREKEEVEVLSQYSPIIETYIQQVRPDKALGIVPKSDFYFSDKQTFGPA